MPIIAIFTKYDQLIEHIAFYDNSENDSEEVKVKAQTVLEEQYIKPFKEQISGKTKIPNVAVSSECDIWRRPVRILIPRPM